MGFLGYNFFRITAVLVLCTIFVQPGRAASAEPRENSLFPQSGSLKDISKSPADEEPFGSAIYRMILGVTVVIVLGLAAMYVSKRVLPKFSTVQGKKIKVIETVHLGSRKTLHLVEISDQQILVGSTPDRITKLADIFPGKEFPLQQPDNNGGTV